MPPVATIEEQTQTAAIDSQHLRSHSDPPSRSSTLVLPLFMTAIFLSSLLVFSVQPMFAKMVLPLLGGSPGVWNTAMLFFQTVLLVGYLYAHLTTRLLGVKWQAGLHVMILAIILFLLPIGVAMGWTPPTEEAPVPWLIGLFAVSVGFPFFAVATNAPLLQRWFSHTGHHDALDPYFLYGASNLGSILALLSYPVLIEPLLNSHNQSELWTAGYTILVGLVLFCAVTLWFHDSPSEPDVRLSSEHAIEDKPSWSQRIHWLVLALVPSSLLLGVTTHITTDIASMPLLWVIPLTLYLLTFVFVFARRPWLRHEWMVFAQPFLLIPIGVQRFLGGGLNIVLPLMVFFVTAMVCHGELVKRRPGATYLTEFYLWMSLGGMLGGVFNVLIAPALFNSILEYPLMLVLACFLRPRQEVNKAFINVQDVAFPIILLLTLGLPSFILAWEPFDWGVIGLILFFTVMGLTTYSFRHRPVRFGLGLATILILTTQLGVHDNILIRERSFFGVNTVTRTEDGKFNRLVHGRTIHGAQHTNPNKWQEQLTYYHQKGPLGQLFFILEKEGIRSKNIAAIGLGAGTIACYQQPEQHWTFYEIDPSVVNLAKDTRYFHFLDVCQGDRDIIYGDGRLSLAKAPDNHYDLLIIDAFSSDAIPIHLMTREALQLYKQKLSDHGLLMFHISNNNLELASVMAKLGADGKFTSLIQKHRTLSEKEQENHKAFSDWVLMASSPEDLDKFTEDSGWMPLITQTDSKVWTDDFSNIVSVLRWWPS